MEGMPPSVLRLVQKARVTGSVNSAADTQRGRMRPNRGRWRSGVVRRQAVLVGIVTCYLLKGCGCGSRYGSPQEV